MKRKITEIEPWLHKFRDEKTVDYSQLTFDPGHNELIVGARNHLFRLRLEDLSLIQEEEWECDEFTKRACFSKGKSEEEEWECDEFTKRACFSKGKSEEEEWECDEFTKRACFSKGKSEEECQNYIRVLLVNGDRLFTCGTNAFTPICTNRTLTDLTEIHDQISGMARCPYSPQHNSTALITSNGELYAATAMDFPGRDPAIYRSLGGLPPLRTAQYNSKWLNEPNIVSSYDIGNFIYFFFRENAVEHDCGKTVFSRAARVCKNDIGGRFLLEDTWTTFTKSRLNCSRPGEIPFYYNELQGTFFLPELELLYGIFTTNVNSIAASAVCVFNLSAVTQVFNGPFKYQENSRSAWLPYPNPNPDFQCGTIDYGVYMNLTERNLQDAQKFILMHEVVQPVTPIPYFMEDNSRFSHIVVDVVQGKDMLFHIIYLATGFRVSSQNTTVLYMLIMTTSLQFLNTTQSMNMTIDGHYGAWSLWKPCSHTDGNSVGSCHCRTRSCDSPAPQCGGQLCEGPSMEVANCSRYCNEHLPCPPHVYWSSWGSWERCTALCGGGVQARHRTCENGNECPGCSLEYQSCNTVSCPEMKKTTPWTPWTPVNISDNGGHYEQRFRYTCKARLADPSLLEVGRQRIEMRYCSSDGTTGCSTDGELLRSGRFSAHSVNGGWSSWTSWSQCSRDCNKGIRSRKRICNNPEPKYGGMPCLGPSQEYQECNITPCPVDGSWSCWSSWSKCSVTCGGGHYLRTRTCTNPAPAYGGDICLGLHTEEALCNTLPCPESWSGWSEWSECDSSGLQVRVRHCDILFPTGNQCYGNRTETKKCIFESNFISEFNLFHMIAVGLSSSLLGCLITLLIYTYCQRYQQQSHDATVIHPISAAPLNTSITNHINKLDKFDSVEAIKVHAVHSVSTETVTRHCQYGSDVPETSGLDGSSFSDPTFESPVHVPSAGLV
ncbi:UNVERIFIED_CONTAM: hypothetical protein FKN15_019480 [Acipenser sinensis]